MKKVLKFLFFLLIVDAVGFGGTYTVIVSEQGNALVTAEFSGNGTLSIPLPIDVGNVIVSGAFYVPTSQGIDISLVEGELATVLFESSLLVTGSEGNWKFSMDLAPGTNSITVSFPRGVSIQTMNPEGHVSQTENSVNVILQTSASSISIQYIFSAEMGNYLLYAGIGAVVIVIILVLVYLYRLKMKVRRVEVKPVKVKPPKKEPGKQSVLRTLSKNQKKIVKILMKYKKGMKRNKLEKLVGLSKSSLAATLNQLEKRKIVDIDKSGKVHYIQLSEWFKKL